jgi:hypothetical protein
MVMRLCIRFAVETPSEATLVFQNSIVPLLIISVMMAVLVLTILNSPPKLVQANPPFEEPAHYEEIYEVLKDGVRKTEHATLSPLGNPEA